MKKILISISMIAIVASIGFGVTRAWFSDTEESTGNTFAAGSLDLEMKADGVPQPVLFSYQNMYPGQVTEDKTLDFKNVGSLTGKVKIEISIDGEADVETQTGEYADDNVTAEEYAKHMFITTAKTAKGSYTPIDVGGYWVDQIVAGVPAYADVDDAKADGAVATVNSVNVPTLYGMSLITVYFDDGQNPPTMDEWASNDEYHTTLGLMFDTEVDNKYQFDGVEASLTATMVQYNDPSF